MNLQKPLVRINATKDRKDTVLLVKNVLHDDAVFGITRRLLMNDVIPVSKNLVSTFVCWNEANVSLYTLS
jgi:hypothetical protein